MQVSAQTALEVSTLDGIGGVLADWMTATVPVAWAPDLSTLAAASVLGALYAGRYFGDDRITTQIYTLGTTTDFDALDHIATVTHALNAAIPAGQPPRAQLSVWREFEEATRTSRSAEADIYTQAVAEWSPTFGRDSVLFLADTSDLKSGATIASRDTARGWWVRELLARFVFVPAASGKDDEPPDVPADLPDEVARALHLHGRLARGGVVRAGTNASDAFADARQAWRGRGPLWAHAETNALKLAMIRAIAADPLEPIMRQDDADFGIRIVSRGIEALEALIAAR
ncbi:hypothetical protein [Azospirillum picis]|uniref:Uncharacterized protein n=1 Tax=Azospirillum picis TaxID=488438 RepID=A0ABU0MUX3_9PROT|nr:hypothetical protein [Azospirillum picis]MBP2303443.1 hypothetical protein [Azospirillum picis]MDQ0537298.1 hypothetical protein [Azospirillum picis]